VPSKKHHPVHLRAGDRESKVKIIVDKRSFHSILKWTQRALISASAIMLTYCAVVVTDTWMFQRREHRRLEQIIQTVDQPNAQPAALVGGLIGSIEIARLRFSVIVMEGDDPTTLRRAAGHLPNSGVPGQPGNIAVAAHRDTLFRPLRHVRRNDVVVFKTPGGEYRYRVVSTKVVKPSDVWVLNPDDGNQILTLITCYPFYFIGSAPDRFIVRAERIT
jgi:sortase A